FVNGLVAPTFLFCAGFAFGISMRRKWAGYAAARPLFWRSLFRLLSILVIGYSLHIPFFSMSRMITQAHEQSWISFFQVDILHTIAVTLMLLTIAVAALRR